jgi:hypothetical protein
LSVKTNITLALIGLDFCVLIGEFTLMPPNTAVG